ncbi:LOB domain-containing protein 11 [Raphanus sativus]|uniref:LOB domain-containing protein 11 n=1 Tax=Raphanus sativus TaxID=3726 RepID=A0A6J0JEZ4_RAPSA|nr:LOB domain-containing protein 11 [Raphanus sativus]KAJ4891203.1 LOB domain-containing protein 11 [Raphanus sativus]
MLKVESIGSTSTATPTSSAVAVVSASETTTPVSSPSPTSSPPPSLSPQQPPQPPVVLSPCAACKILRRRCAEKCVLAPYFPPTDPAKFTIAHRVFGASNIIKFLQELPESQRTDAVNSMVYEAGARMRDPVYGCAGAIYHLQRQVSELQAQLAKTQVELVSMHLQRSDLLELLYKMEQTKLSAQEGHQNMSFESSFDSGDELISSPDEVTNDLGFLEDTNNNNSSMSWWDPLWS